MKSAVVIEKAGANYPVDDTDLTEGVAAGETVEVAERRLRKASEVYIKGLREGGLTAPDPTSLVDYLERLCLI